jgi:hypothetical protein
MKKILLLFLLTIIFTSCRKVNDNPDWLESKISMMDTNDYYFGTTIYLYKWNKDYYYWISIPVSSCIMCEFYNYSGEKFVWTQENIDDFQKNSKKIRTVWQRDKI